MPAQSTATNGLGKQPAIMDEASASKGLQPKACHPQLIIMQTF